MVQSNRASRFEGRAALRRVTVVPRCVDCGREPNGQGVQVRRSDAGVVGFAGLVSCGRVWLCPVCNAKIMASRAVELGLVLAWASARGYHVIWGSLTMRHNYLTPLDWMLQAQRDAWAFVVGSKTWRAHSATTTVQHVHDSQCAKVGCQGDHAHNSDCAARCDRRRDQVLTSSAGRVGYVRAAELTTGENGWHPHFHPVIIYRGTKVAAQAFADQVVALWVEGVERTEGAEARAIGGQLLRVVSGVDVFNELTGYITKGTYDHAKLALETTWSQGKTGRGRVKGTVSHWDLLARIALAQADWDAFDDWQELEESMGGHRMLMWSRGLRQFAGLGLELTDEQLADAEVGTKDDSVCFITAEGWLAIRDDHELLASILDLVESSGWVGLRPYLDLVGVDYRVMSGASV